MSATETTPEEAANTAASDLKLTWIGVGAMGSLMAPHTTEVADLHVFDVDADQARRVAEESSSTAVSDLSKIVDSDIVILMLPESSIIDPLLNGDGDAPGLLDQLKPGAIVVDMSSSRPDSSVKNAEAAKRRGVRFIDAPVSGGVSGARNATLAIMVGGPIEDFEAVKPILDHIGTNVRHVGQIGAGHALKALNNILAASNLQASVEVLAAGKKFGLDPAVMVDVMQKSSGSNFALLEVIPQAVLTGQYDAGFALKLMEKDVRVAMSLFELTHAPSRVLSAVAEVYARGLKEAEADADYTVIAKQNDDLAGIGR